MKNSVSSFASMRISTFPRIKMAEGVGFEPTVGYPTLDFESSALNRTQPPFPFSQSAGVPALIINCAGVIVNSGLRINGGAEEGTDFKSVMAGRDPFPESPQNGDTKNVTILGLPRGLLVLHIVCPLGNARYYLLLTRFHRLLAPLFTIIRT